MSHVATILADHESDHGPVVTHVRALLLVNAIGCLRELGLYDAYVREMSQRHVDVVMQTLAASWLPVEHAIAHYEAVDRISISAPQLVALGAYQAQRIQGTFLGITLQRARSLGVDALTLSFTQVGRLHDRIYRGGGCTALHVGPKDLRFEIHGFPFARTHTFQAAWVSYCKAMAELFSRVAYVKLVRPRQPHAMRLALSANWV